MILRVELDGSGEQVDRFIIVFGRESLVTLIFQSVRLP
jgi:hypothetical protein